MWLLSRPKPSEFITLFKSPLNLHPANVHKFIYFVSLFFSLIFIFKFYFILIFKFLKLRIDILKIRLNSNIFSRFFFYKIQEAGPYIESNPRLCVFKLEEQNNNNNGNLISLVNLQKPCGVITVE